MANVSKIFKFIIFADDTNLFCSNYDIHNLAITVCEELKQLECWFALNRLSLNVSKTSYMFLVGLDENMIYTYVLVMKKFVRSMKLKI